MAIRALVWYHIEVDIGKPVEACGIDDTQHLVKCLLNETRSSFINRSCAMIRQSIVLM
jgi:hypothetical protein